MLVLVRGNVVILGNVVIPEVYFESNNFYFKIIRHEPDYLTWQSNSFTDKSSFCECSGGSRKLET